MQLDAEEHKCTRNMCIKAIDCVGNPEYIHLFHNGVTCKSYIEINLDNIELWVDFDDISQGVVDMLYFDRKGDVIAKLITDDIYNIEEGTVE